jgi:uncharacterized protein YneF (UPF0154 family)
MHNFWDVDLVIALCPLLTWMGLIVGMLLGYYLTNKLNKKREEKRCE